MDEEKTLGIIPNLNHRKGFLKYEACNLIVTDRRLILALLTKEMAKEAARKAREEGEARGETCLTKAVHTLTAGSTVYERYRTMHPAEILTEAIGNVAINLDEVRSFRVESGEALGSDDAPHPDRLILKTTAGKHVFTFGTKSLSAKEAKVLLEQALGKSRT